MYCDTENSISEVARVLEPGGQFYCGYSSTGFRLNAIYAAASKRRHAAFKAQLGNYVGAALRRDGISRKSWSDIRCATLEELAAVCRAFGLRLLRRPGLQDGSRDFAGIPGTVDLLCVRSEEPQAFRTRLLDLSAASAAGRVRYRELLRLGLGKLVYSVLQERAEALHDPEIRSLYVLAGLHAGQAEAVGALAEDGLDPLVRGLLAFDLGRIAEAVAAFRSLVAGSSRPQFPARRCAAPRRRVGCGDNGIRGRRRGEASPGRMRIRGQCWRASARRVGPSSATAWRGRSASCRKRWVHPPRRSISWSSP